MKYLETKKLVGIVGAIIIGVFLIVVPMSILAAEAVEITAEDATTTEEIVSTTDLVTLTTEFFSDDTIEISSTITEETTEEKVSLAVAVYGLISQEEPYSGIAENEQRKGLEELERNKPKPSRTYTDLTQYEGIPDDVYENMVKECKRQISEQHLSPAKLERKRQGEKYLKEKEEEERRAAEAAYYYSNSYSYDAGPSSYAPPSGDGCLTPGGGVYYYGNQKETYYNLPMDGLITMAYQCGLEGEYWIREDGCKMLGDYIILATNRDVHPIGSLVETSLGTGIAIDTGGFAAYNPYQVDIATSW